MALNSLHIRMCIYTYIFYSRLSFDDSRDDEHMYRLMADIVDGDMPPDSNI